MQKVFIIIQFNYENDIKTNIWTSIESMIERRMYAACTVFEGKIVVSGGFREEEISNEVYPDGSMYISLDYRIIKLKSIEGFDFHENKWYYFPDMLSPRINHSAVSIGNKMFLIGGTAEYSEVFDSITRKFTYIKTLPKWVRTSELDFYDISSYKVVSIGDAIYFLQIGDKKINVHSYEVRKNRFCYKTSIEIESFKKIGCIKVPTI